MDSSLCWENKGTHSKYFTPKNISLKPRSSRFHTLPGSKCVFLCVYPQLHLLHCLPQEEELLHLALVLAVETQEVLLGHFLRGDGLVSQVTGLGVIGLEELVEVSLDSELIL